MRAIKYMVVLYLGIWLLTTTLHAQMYGNLTDEEWQYTYDFCMQNNQNACDYLIDNGLISSQDCYDNQCNIVGVIYTLAGRYEEAVPYFEKLCNSGNMVSCGNLADTYYFHVKDYFKAKHYYEMACKNNNNASCYDLGIMYGNGEGVRQSFDKEDAFYKKACGGKEPLGCYNLGVVYEKRSEIKNHNSIAKEYYGKACDYGYQAGCDRYREYNEIGVK